MGPTFDDPAHTSLGKAISLLGGVSDYDRPVGVTELARRVGLSKSTVHRLAAILTDAGYLQRVEGGRYQLGLRIFELGSRAWYPNTIRAKASPVLHELTRHTGATSHLAILDGDDVVYVEKVEPSVQMKIPSKVGYRNPAVSTAVGKALLAWKTHDELLAIAKRGFPRYTDRSLTSLGQLLGEVDSIRRLGLAFDNGERQTGLTCVAAPIRDASHRVVAAISLSWVGERADSDRVDLGNVTRQVAAQIRLN